MMSGGVTHHCRVRSVPAVVGVVSERVTAFHGEVTLEQLKGFVESLLPGSIVVEVRQYALCTCTCTYMVYLVVTYVSVYMYVHLAYLHNVYTCTCTVCVLCTCALYMCIFFRLCIHKVPYKRLP